MPKVSTEKVMAKMFPQDPLTPIRFLEDPEKRNEEGSINCILTSWKHNQDILELKAGYT